MEIQCKKMEAEMRCGGCPPQTCKPSCAHDDVEAVLMRYRIADISVGIGIVTAAVATWLLWPRADAKDPTTARHARVSPSVGPNGGGLSVEIPLR